MKNFRVVCLFFVMSVFALAGFGQGNRTLTYPVTYVETMVDAATLQSLAQEFSVDRVDRNADGTFKTRICLSFKDFDNFLAKNVDYTAIPQTRAYVQMAQNYSQMTTNWNRYPTYNTYLATMDTFQSRFPSLCKIDTLLAATPEGHMILCAHISNNLNDNEGKPSVLYISTIHGDEVTGYHMMLRVIHYLLNNYSTDSYVADLVNNTDIWICPLYNPDGTYFQSDNQINESPVSIRYNSNWEDLNRVFPLVGSPAKSNYEPEVEAMMQFMAAHNFTLASNFHGGAEVFNYPWDSWTTWQHSHADAAWWNFVGRKFADTCHTFNPYYMIAEDNGVTEGGDWYVITGSMQDYHNWYLGTRHVTIEVSDNKVLSSSQLPNYWNYIKRSFFGSIGAKRTICSARLQADFNGMEHAPRILQVGFGIVFSIKLLQSCFHILYAVKFIFCHNSSTNFFTNCWHFIDTFT